MSQKHILVTAALPYANGPLHLGHMLEWIQTDIWVKFQRHIGNNCIFVGATDAHGTPTMLAAEKLNISPKVLVENSAEQHKKVLMTYRISLDNYVTTDCIENHEITKLIFERLLEKNLVIEKVVDQAFDDEKQMFLPDRFVKGTCPRCKSINQNGDSCDACGATYSPLELIDPKSTLSNSTPSIKKSNHLFFKLNTFKDYLEDWVNNNLNENLKNKLFEWFSDELQDWTISRDEPYFGIEIPGYQGKYFYVWFDATIGYMASFKNYCGHHGINFDDYWSKDSKYEVYHFIGKDITYFHCLFWPAVLEGADFRTPTSVFAHGFVTVNGEKMSKSKGTFILAEEFSQNFEPDILRYYYASKLSDTIEDIDLNYSDLVNKINSDLVGKLINLASRCSGFISKLNNKKLSNEIYNIDLITHFQNQSLELMSDYQDRKYSKVIRKIMSLCDEANKYIDKEKPWLLAKSEDQKDKAIQVCSDGIQLFRILIIFLKPIIPDIAKKSELFLNAENLLWVDHKKLINGAHIQDFSPILSRIEMDQLNTLKGN